MSAASPPTIPIERLPGHPQFVHLSAVAGALDIDLRYPTANNFAGRVLYTHWDCAWLRAEAATGLEADMGSGFDEMSERSHPALHDDHLSRGVLQAEHVQVRGLLTQAMAAGGFGGISTEWWHFDLGDRRLVRQTGPRVD